MKYEFREGYIKDYITGKSLKNTKNERRRQDIEKRLVEIWRYPKELIDIEVAIQRERQSLGRADIVVFTRESKNPNTDAYIIVEVKKESRKEGLAQLENYIKSTTAKFGIWYNGRDLTFIRRLSEPHQFQEISRIPKYRESFKDLEKQLIKDDLNPAFDLEIRFNEIQDYLYANEGFLKEKLFEVITKLLFMKIVDEKSSRNEVWFWVSEKEYEELFEKGYSKSFMNRIQGLWEETKNTYPEMEGDLLLKPFSIAEIIKRLGDVSLITTRDTVKEKAFQTFIPPMRADMGELFTPQPVIELAIDMLNPNSNESIIDPACGTGRFLTWTMSHVKKKEHLNSSELANYARTHLNGIDINPDSIKVAKANMVLFGDGETNLFVANSLLPFDKLADISEKNAIPKPARPEPNKFDVILTNPPFGQRRVNDTSESLVQFDLAHKWEFDERQNIWIKSSLLLNRYEHAVLFIERGWQLLKLYGRMAIVLPDRILTSLRLAYVRQWIMDHARILAVVSLPNETFAPHGFGIKTSLLFLQKVPKEDLAEIKEKDYSIFMSTVEKVGYDAQGKTSFLRDEEGNVITDENDIRCIDTDIPNIIRAFETFKMEHELGF